MYMVAMLHTWSQQSFHGVSSPNQHPLQAACISPIRALDSPPHGSPLLRMAVSATTQLLRIFSINNRKDAPPNRSTSVGRELTRVQEVVDALMVDYQQSYFLTGEFTTSLYAEDCYFADPTISFTGTTLYERNLKLLVPFFEEPSITLFSLNEETGDPGLIRANWQLRTFIKLPWRPLICVDGCTTYTLDRNLKIARHIESWSISPVQAVCQLFKPGDKPF